MQIEGKFCQPVLDEVNNGFYSELVSSAITHESVNDRQNMKAFFFYLMRIIRLNLSSDRRFYLQSGVGEFISLTLFGIFKKKKVSKISPRDMKVVIHCCVFL